MPEKEIESYPRFQPSFPSSSKLVRYESIRIFMALIKRSGVSTAIISESLGHSSERVTQIYLDSFENSQIDEAMKNLL